MKWIVTLAPEIAAREATFASIGCQIHKLNTHHWLIYTYLYCNLKSTYVI